jgi:hypothetical protein
VEARVLRAEGRHADALAAAERGLVVRGELSITDGTIRVPWSTRSRRRSTSPSSRRPKN